MVHVKELYFPFRLFKMIRDTIAERSASMMSNNCLSRNNITN